MDKYPRIIIQELLERAEKEQHLRERWEENLENQEFIDAVKAVDEDNTVFLKDFIAKYGWPKISEIGKKEAMAAWLILQHSPDKEFMETCLKIMQAMPDEVEPANLARTIDRVRILNGEKQYYGTHFSPGEDGKYYPKPIEDEEHVEERRAAMGLPTMEEKFKEYNS